MKRQRGRGRIKRVKGKKNPKYGHLKENAETYKAITMCETYLYPDSKSYKCMKRNSDL